VSSDTSPKSGYRLEQPTRTAGATGPPIRHPGRRPVSPAPSWASVISTTLRLWVRRHVLRVPDTARIGTRRRVTVAAVVVAVAAAIAAVIVLAGPQAASHNPTAHKLTPAQVRARAAAARQAAANATAAAAWIATEVSPQTVIGCDAAACTAVQSAAYTGSQVVLQPGVKLPGEAGTLIVATPAVRAQYRAQLGDDAPAVLAAFGTGPQAVQVRLVVPGGAAAYSQAAAGAVAARRTAGLRLIANARVHPRPIARADLAAGLVDPRLLTVFAKLAAAHYPVYIIWFADSGPVAGGLAPFRQAEIGGLTNTHARGQLSQLAAVEKLLAVLPGGNEASMTAVALPAGRYGLQLHFLGPSPH
jgi:hypothetical protein